MSVFVQVLIIASFIGLLAVIGWAVLATRRENLRRMAMLHGARDRFEDAVVTKSPWRYPRIDATFEGSPIRVDLVPDSMLRKGLPVLWAQLTWTRPHPGDLFVTKEPRAGEYLKEPDIHSRRRLPMPEAWPETTFASGNGAAAQTMLEALDGFDPAAHKRLKQIAITRTDVTVTIRAAYARRPHRVFLASEVFATSPVDPRVVDQGLAVLRQVESALADDPRERSGETKQSDSADPEPGERTAGQRK